MIMAHKIQQVVKQARQYSCKRIKKCFKKVFKMSHLLKLKV